MKKVINVYQHKFKDFIAPGFGDYIRGCFHMLQVLRIFNTHCNTAVTFDMDMRNHPISKFIETYPMEECSNYSILTNYFIDSLEVKNDPNDVGFRFILDNVLKFFSKIKEETYFTFCCKFPVFLEIEEGDKEFIRSRLIPNDTMAEYIEQKMQGLDIQKKEYSVIHIRIRDEVSFPPVALENSRMEKIERLLTPALKTGVKYLLITNHNDVKRHFKNRENIVFTVGDICHVGQRGV